MSEPVRLRGEVAHRKSGDGKWWTCDPHIVGFPSNWNVERRTNLDLAQRVDAIVAHLQARRLADLQEAQREIQRLTLLLNEHMDEIAHLTGTVEHLRAENEKLRAVEEIGRIGSDTNGLIQQARECLQRHGPERFCDEFGCRSVMLAYHMGFTDGRWGDHLTATIERDRMLAAGAGAGAVGEEQ